MTRAERIERRLRRLHSVEDAVITVFYYGVVWSVFMVVIGRMFKVM